MSSWSRKDVHGWWKNQKKSMLSECGCETEEHSLYSEGMYKPDYFEPLQPMVDSSIDNAVCPDSYSKSLETFCQHPHEVLQELRPLMVKIGVGCPQSFALALADMFEVAMDVGVIKPFNTEM